MSRPFASGLTFRTAGRGWPNWQTGQPTRPPRQSSAVRAGQRGTPSAVSQVVYFRSLSSEMPLLDSRDESGPVERYALERPVVGPVGPEAGRAAY